MGLPINLQKNVTQSGAKVVVRIEIGHHKTLDELFAIYVIPHTALGLANIDCPAWCNFCQAGVVGPELITP